MFGGLSSIMRRVPPERTRIFGRRRAGCTTALGFAWATRPMASTAASDVPARRMSRLFNPRSGTADAFSGVSRRTMLALLAGVFITFSFCEYGWAIRP